MPDTTIVYKWRILDVRGNKWRELRWRMTEDDAAAYAIREGVQIEKVEGSQEKRQDINGQRHWGNLSSPPGWEDQHR